MEKALLSIIKMMPIWFGLFFLGPLMAEILTRTAIASYVPFALTSLVADWPLYPTCMAIGGFWGGFAYLSGRWI